MNPNETAPGAGTAREDCFCGGRGPQATRAFRMKSEAARQHFRNSRIEFLKAIRTLIDERIQRLSRTGQQGTSVPVD